MAWTVLGACRVKACDFFERMADDLLKMGEPDLQFLVLGGMSPEDLRKEASASEFLAQVVSYAPDKARLRARAAELRAMAEAMDGSPAGPPPEHERRRQALAIALRAMPRHRR